MPIKICKNFVRQFFGASISAVCEVIKPKNYKLWKIVYNHAFFIDAEVCNDLIVDLTSLVAWRSGYKEAPIRENFFIVILMLITG